ncbi:MAG: methyl-accepting chemotaxis protein [Nitrospiraceae bacterium]
MTTKLVLLFVLFALVPMSVVGWIAFSASTGIVDGVGQQFEYAAVNMADTVDRNLFERYGDVQAFGLNSAVFNVTDWYVPDEEKSQLVKVMNQYVDTYDNYYLTLLVDTGGRLVAVNTRDADGKPIDTRPLYAKNFSDTPWFQALKAKQFTTKMPYSAPGNDALSGTFVEDIHVDPDVKRAYLGDDALTIGFSAPVYRNGQVVGYWSNRTKFSIVEDVIRAGVATLKTTGHDHLEATLLDSSGRILVDYDPSSSGTEKIVRDFNNILKVNLADAGLEVARKAVRGERGYTNALHARKDILQAVGYAHLKGAMGFAGMNWSLLVRSPLDMAAAGAKSIQRQVLTAAVVCMIPIVLMGLLFGKKLVKRLSELIASARALAAGNLAARVTVTGSDEIAQAGLAFNGMAEQLSRSMVEQKTAAEAAQAQAAEVKSVTNAIGKAQAVIEFNLDGTILTANDNFQKALGYSLDEIKGQHHRMFCEPSYTNSGDYTAFWQKLNRGEFDAGVYKRLGKGGKEIWIQASYNPIMDANGKPYKVMKFATDITEQKNKSAEFEGKINAVNKAQAAIEFNLDGTVLTANDNFLNCLGYSLGEIKGQHHRMFCEPSYTNSGDYAAFWQKLNRGEFDAGVYKRLGKGGKEIWIQASYNPIVNANGKVYKVVKFATDITAQQKAKAEMERLVAEAQAVLGRLSESDLTTSMAGEYSGELDKIKTSINAVVHNLTKTIVTVKDAVENVSAAAQEITKGNEDLAQRTSQQAGALEETSASMEEMTSTVKQNADNAKQANQLAIAARDVADKGGSITTRAVTAMEEINKSSKKIADIITVIDEIAFQTNLLALNAAVEAARAGEHGRGFAVVATEVRNLAQRSATAAKEIKGLINESIQRVSDGSELVNQSGKTLEEIVGSVKRVTDIIAEIAAASQEQAQGIDQVNKAISQMDEGTQQNAALVEETTSASQSMTEQAKELSRQVVAFKVNGGSGGAKVSPAPAMTGPKPMAKAMPKPEAKPANKPAAAHHETVAAGGGKAKHDDFEEF